MEPGSRRRVSPVLAPFGVSAAMILLAAASFAVVLPTVRSAVGVGRQVLRQLSEPLRIPRMPVRSTIYGADGSVMAQIYLNQNRAFVPLRHIPPLTREAVLAVEDARFYQHGAVD